MLSEEASMKTSVVSIGTFSAKAIETHQQPPYRKTWCWQARFYVQTSTRENLAYQKTLWIPCLKKKHWRKAATLPEDNSVQASRSAIYGHEGPPCLEILSEGVRTHVKTTVKISEDIPRQETTRLMTSRNLFCKDTHWRHWQSFCLKTAFVKTSWTILSGDTLSEDVRNHSAWRCLLWRQRKETLFEYTVHENVKMSGTKLSEEDTGNDWKPWLNEPTAHRLWRRH